VAGPTSNSVQLPEGPFTATNYSGTQMNFWGVAPSSVPQWVNSSPYDTPSQLGAVTNSVLQVISCSMAAGVLLINYRHNYFKLNLQHQH